MKRAENIFNTVSNVIRLSKERRILPHEAAYKLAQERIKAARKNRSGR